MLLKQNCTIPITLYAGFQSEELAHIAAEEMKKVEEAVQKKQQWLNEQLQKFEKLPKSSDPPTTTAQISAESKVPVSILELSRLYDFVAIINNL